MRRLATRDPQVIRVDALWLAIEPLDMRPGTEAALARVVRVFGAARPYHAYLLANRRANRMKVLVHGGIGIWLSARRLHQGKFAWPKDSGYPQLDPSPVRCAGARASVAACRRSWGDQRAVVQLPNVLMRA